MGKEGLNPEFEECLRKGKIKEFSRGKSLVKKELNTAESDLENARITFKSSSYKWATIQSYYSMFHSARALLYAKNYRERSHYCLLIAIKALYLEKKLIPSYLLDKMQKAKTLRESADYYDEWSKEGAEQLIKSAEEFFKYASELIIKK